MPDPSPASGRHPQANGGDKAAMRASILQRRAQRSPDVRDAAAEAVAAHLLGTAFAQVPTVAAYLSMGTEPGTRRLIDQLIARGTEVLVPIGQPDGTLDWARHRPEATLTPSSIGVPEPDGERLGSDALARAKLVIVPALAVDHNGWRLGRGAGYFDRALAAHPHGLVCALVYADELVPTVPHDDHDVAVDLVASEAGIFRVL